MADIEVELRQIEVEDRLTGFSVGDPDLVALKIFLQKHAKAYHQQSLARTYAVFRVGPAPKVIAYVTLVCGEVAVDEGSDDLLGANEVDYRYRHFPAVKIARLAVDVRFQGHGLGTRLVDLALGTAKAVVSPAVGCRFVVVDAKRSAVDFYGRCGFTMLDTPANRARQEPVMFVDLHRISAPEPS